MKIIAVSRDLLEIGLTRGAEVEIEGIPGKFRVLDKMGRRWEKRIDIYMGDDIQAAREWGVRNVEIYY
jgi:3D (Asp-Asp-Asp) domain-containing protein